MWIVIAGLTGLICGSGGLFLMLPVHLRYRNLLTSLYLAIHLLLLLYILLLLPLRGGDSQPLFYSYPIDLMLQIAVFLLLGFFFHTLFSFRYRTIWNSAMTFAALFITLLNAAEGFIPPGQELTTGWYSYSCFSLLLPVYFIVLLSMRRKQIPGKLPGRLMLFFVMLFGIHYSGMITRKLFYLLQMELPQFLQANLFHPLFFTGWNCALFLFLLRHIYIKPLPMPENSERTARIAALLSPREIEIARWLAAGYSRRDIADRLYISELTVKTHIRNIYRKLEITSRVELVRTLDAEL